MYIKEHWIFNCRFYLPKVILRTPNESSSAIFSEMRPRTKNINTHSCLSFTREISSVPITPRFRKLTVQSQGESYSLITRNNVSPRDTTYTAISQVLQPLNPSCRRSATPRRRRATSNSYYPWYVARNKGGKRSKREFESRNVHVTTEKTVCMVYGSRGHGSP